GVLYAPNITPDPETGIGNWSEEDFWHALHEGRAKDGTLLYPGFPYTNYTKVVRADADGIFAYLRSIPPIHKARRPHELRFPYNERKLLIAWRALYFRAGEYDADPAQTKEWNRGAYLVSAVGHCDMCHSTRNMVGAVADNGVIVGRLIPVQNWYAPSLTSSRETGLGDWEIAEVMDLLKTGVCARGAVFGPMATVVQDGLQYLSREDLQAMVVYLESQAQEEEPEAPSQFKGSAAQTEAMMKQGAKLYTKHCADCHQRDGRGVPRVW